MSAQKHEPLITDVSDTAFWVAHYRARESARPDALFRDPLAARLVGERGARLAAAMPAISRYTEWSVVSRTVIIDRFVSQLVREGADAVINLGAGLDTRPYRMALPHALEWVEVDRPSIIRHKEAQLAAEIPQCRLSRIAADLADDGQRRAALASAAPGARRAVVLTEGVLPYLSPAQVSALAADLLAQPRLAYWIAEYFDPRVYRHLQSAVRQAAMRNAPFRFYPDDWYGFFRQAGWSPRETRYTGEVAVESGRRPPMPTWARLIVPFLPKRVRQEALRQTGYVVFRRGS
jgi:methyltransferase (TIGR00027 family)